MINGILSNLKPFIIQRYSLESETKSNRLGKFSDYKPDNRINSIVRRQTFKIGQNIFTKELILMFCEHMKRHSKSCYQGNVS